MADDRNFEPAEAGIDEEDLYGDVAKAFDELADAEGDGPSTHAETELVEEVSDQEASPNQDDEETGGETAETSYEAPADWSADDRAVFDAQSDEAKEFLLRRHTEMQRNYTEKTEAIADINRAIDPYGELFERSGVTPGEGLRYLLSAHEALTTKPIPTLEWMLSQHVSSADDARRLIGTLQNQFAVDQQDRDEFDYGEQPSQPQSDPELLRRLEQLETRGVIQEQEQANHLVATFSQTTDDQGQPRYPHFEQVRQTMASMYANGMVSNLEEAYDKAVRMDDDLYQQSLSTVKRSALDGEAGKAAKAKSKVLPRGGRNDRPAPSASSSDDESLADTVGRLYDELAS